MLENNSDRICCANCKFFDSKTSFCRRNPPTPLIVFKGPQKFVECKFPVIKMSSIDYCGEYISNQEII